MKSFVAIFVVDVNTIVEEIVQILVIWDAMSLIQSHCNDWYDKVKLNMKFQYVKELCHVDGKTPRALFNNMDWF